MSVRPSAGPDQHHPPPPRGDHESGRDRSVNGGRPIVFRNATVLTMDSAGVVEGGDVLVIGEHDRRGRHRSLAVPDGRRGDRRHRRHPDARHGRHPPAHVADGTARPGRRLDPHPVLRLLLPDLGQDLPPGGHPRRQPAVGDRGGRCRGDDDGRLVARPADHRPRRGRRSTRCGPRPGGSSSPTATCSARRGSGPTARTSAASSRAGSAAATRCSGLQLAFDVTGDPAFPEQGAFEAARELGLRGHHPRRGVGRDQRREHPADVGGRLHDAATSPTCMPRR